MYKESCTKHEAIVKAKEMINGNGSSTKANSPTQVPMDELPKIAVLTKMFTYFKNGVHNSKPAKEYLQKRGLDFTITDVGYNSGQFHHGTRKDEALITSCIKYGILLDLGTKSRTGNPAYKPFGKWCICFALKNKEGKITGLYFRSTLDDKKQRHFYLRDRQGLYPNYPSKDTKKLILTESIIDAATLLEQNQIKSQYEILSLYGTNGLTEEHQKAIKGLEDLEEIIFFLNGDQAGNKAVQKYAPMLKGEYPNVKISNVQVPENEDVNSLLQGHSPEILSHLIKTRKEYDFLFSIEEEAVRTESTDIPIETEPKKEEPRETVQTGLDTNNPYNLKYTGLEADYQIKGFKINQLDSLKITLQIAAR
jgi:DNA primase